MLILLGIAPVCFSSFRLSALLVSLGIYLVVVILFLLGFSAWLKRITVLSDGLELKSGLLPSWKRFYRFAEFD